MNFTSNSVNSVYEDAYYNSSRPDKASTNVSTAQLSHSNRQAIDTIKSFATLAANWDTYGAIPPSTVSIQKAITFILWLNRFNLDVFFVAPSPNGDILVELKQEDSNLEFEFSEDDEDTVVASHEGDLYAEENLNQTTQLSYIKWLICPDGNCPPHL